MRLRRAFSCQPLDFSLSVLRFIYCAFGQQHLTNANG